jgi:hypothetical protein
LASRDTSSLTYSQLVKTKTKNVHYQNANEREHNNNLQLLKKNKSKVDIPYKSNNTTYPQITMIKLLQGIFSKQNNRKNYPEAMTTATVLEDGSGSSSCSGRKSASVPSNQNHTFAKSKNGNEPSVKQLGESKADCSSTTSAPPSSGKGLFQMSYHEIQRRGKERKCTNYPQRPSPNSKRNRSRFYRSR